MVTKIVCKRNEFNKDGRMKTKIICKRKKKTTTTPLTHNSEL